MNTNKTRMSDSTRRKLLEDSISIFSQSNHSHLAQAVRSFFPGITNAFLLYWLPEQAEDIYWLLVSRTEIAKIEVTRHQETGENNVSVELISVDAYRHTTQSSKTREKLEIAIELIGL